VSEPVVVVRKLFKEFRRAEMTIPVLQGINLEMLPGDFLALMGPSGSGKSTLLNLVAGLDKPTSGTLRVVGEDLGSMSEGSLARWRSQHVGFIFQLYNLIPVLTAYENVELPLTLTSLSRRERDEHVKAALKVVGLSDRLDHYPRQLSGGQEQRVAIARAIATDPTLLVADEPTGDLDAKSAGEILDLMERLNKEFGKTIIMVTHDPHAAARATRLLHLEKGVLVDEVAPLAATGRSA
jgi:putative ABC transport system ATP-binding protein